MMSDELVVTIAGGGASAHVLIPLLSGAGHTVQLLTRRPADWSPQISAVKSGLRSTAWARACRRVWKSSRA